MIIEPNNPAPQFPTVPGGEPSVPSGDAGSAKSGSVSASSVERADAMSEIIVTKSPQAATIPPLPHYSPSQGAATALEGRMSSPASPAIVSSSGPVHFADREHLTVPDDVDLSIPAFLKRSA